MRYKIGQRTIGLKTSWVIRTHVLPYMGLQRDSLSTHPVQPNSNGKTQATGATRKEDQMKGCCCPTEGARALGAEGQALNQMNPRWQTQAGAPPTTSQKG